MHTDCEQQSHWGTMFVWTLQAGHLFWQILHALPFSWGHIPVHRGAFYPGHQSDSAVASAAASLRKLHFWLA